jgi:hypothetical protein
MQAGKIVVGLAALGLIAAVGLLVGAKAGDTCCGVMQPPAAGHQEHASRNMVSGQAGEDQPAKVAQKELLERLETALKSLDQVRKHLDGGKTKEATEELGKAQELLKGVHEALVGHHPKEAAGVVNVKCPITGEAIDPAKVPANLIVEFKGRKVGFCCGSCPPAWNNLSDQEKQAKLSKALLQPK